MRKFNVKVNGTEYQVEIEETNAFSTVAPVSPVAPIPHAPIAPVVPTATAITPVETATTEVKNINKDGIKLSCPMPGTIVKILANDGDTVKKGQVIVVLEAMKMENDIVAPESGVITVVAKQGANVNSGDLLAVIS